METSVQGLGRCSCAFWLAVVFDILGLIVLLIGVFANFFFYDFLIYAGAIIIFLSLIWWIFWYTGNIEVPPEELEDDVGLLKKDRGIGAMVRRLSTRISNGVRNSFRRHRRASGHGEGPATMPGHPMQDRGARERVPVALSMDPHENVYTVSASVGEELTAVSHTSTETSAI